MENCMQHGKLSTYNICMYCVYIKISNHFDFQTNKNHTKNPISSQILINPSSRLTWSPERGQTAAAWPPATSAASSLSHITAKAWPLPLFAKAAHVSATGDRLINRRLKRDVFFPKRFEREKRALFRPPGTWAGGRVAGRAGARVGRVRDAGGPGGGGPGGAASGLGAGRGLAPLEKAAFRITRASYCWFYLYDGSRGPHLPCAEAVEVVGDGMVFWRWVFGGLSGNLGCFFLFCDWKFCRVKIEESHRILYWKLFWLFFIRMIGKFWLLEEIFFI